MAANSFTGEINTNNEFKTVESQADGFTFTVGKVYTMQVQNDSTKGEWMASLVTNVIFSRLYGLSF